MSQIPKGKLAGLGSITNAKSAGISYGRDIAQDVLANAPTRIASAIDEKILNLENDANEWSKSGNSNLVVRAWMLAATKEFLKHIFGSGRAQAKGELYTADCPARA
jgi:hypothetical protein